MDIIAGTPYEHLDPSTTLSQLDVVNLLTVYCNKVVNSCLKSERNYIDEIIKIVIGKIGEVTEALLNLIKSQETKVIDIDLKIDTTCSYLEELLYNLKNGLHATFSLIQNDIEYLMTKTDISCNLCGVMFRTQEHLNNHTYNHHNHTQIQPSICYTEPPSNQRQEIPHASFYICTICDEQFQSDEYLESHIQGNHGNTGAFKCYICDHYFRSHHALASHINNYHGRNISFKCMTCEQTFSTEENLNLHHSSTHVDKPELVASSSNYECEKCAQICENFADFCEHHACHHPEDQFCPCDICEQTFSSIEILESHLDSDHCLQQVDGPLQDISDFPSLSNQGNIRTKTFALNQPKQVTEIRKDARISDFEINVNNSDENCTIKCSSGFYIQVAQSCFLTLDETTVFNVSGVVISISDIIKTNDKNGSEVNRLIHFTFTSEQQSSGGVAVHLHHSTRNIQVQGSHKMPDHSKAALWFVNNVVVKKFKEQAKTKKFAIKNFNDSLQRVSASTGIVPNTSNSNACRECNIIFNSRSKPSFCSDCSEYFHKSCLKDHSKTCIHVPSVISTMTAPCSSSTATAAEAPTSGVSWPASASSSSTPSIQPPGSQPLINCVPEVPPVIPGLRTVVTFVPPAPVQSSPVIQSSSPDLPSIAPVQPPNTKNKNGKKKTTKSVTVSSNDTNTQFLQKELAAAQARIVQLDATIVDKEQQAEILLARVKILEEQQNKHVFDKYFPQNQPNPSTDRINVSGCSSNLVHHCPAQQCCQMLHSCCSHHNNHPHGHPTSKLPCQHHLNQTPETAQLKAMFEQHTEKLTADINYIKATIKDLQLDKSNNNNHAQTMEHSGDHDPHQSSNECTEQWSPRPASVTSVEEFIPDNLLNNSPLNF